MTYVSYDAYMYYHPEVHSLELVAEHEQSSGSYEFDIIAVWRDKEGQYYMGTASGCSCPTPFEYYAAVGELTGPLSVDQILEEAGNLKRAHYDPNSNLENWNTFIIDVRESQTRPFKEGRNNES